ncbi:glycosyltransferase family 4 protein [Marinibacterium sp. SX1]|uniref:glycosyltransferase family 4 protein n=1 Tax=Marinibacterium sp. SX1 TaxID=3388424 RepID=UPI003D16FB46
MHIAFFAPLKAPNHPVPSGDREMARNLMGLLAARGDRVILASELRLRDGSGDLANQRRLAEAAAEEVARLDRELPADLGLWVSYHNYYKAPDLLGPEIARRRGVPYVLIEASRARKRLTGPWAGFAAAAEAASDAAAVIFHPTAHDRETLDRDRPPGQALAPLPPFLAASALPPAGRPVPGRLLAAGMMRPGDKMASYRLIAETLPALTHPDWHLHIAGDGPAGPAVRALFAPFGDRVRFLGQLDQADLQAAYGTADLFLWPGVNEAFGMVYVEAQAHGLPVVAQDRPGVRDVVTGPQPPVPAGPAGMALRCNWLLADPARRQDAGLAARRAVAERHLAPAAARAFWSVVTPLLEDRP